MDLGVAQWQGYQTTAPIGALSVHIPAGTTYTLEATTIVNHGPEDLVIDMRRGGRLRGYANTPSLTTGEFAEEYYDQCFGTSRTPQERARELLFEHLTEEEKAHWNSCGWLLVTAKSGRQYGVSPTNVERMDDRHTFCVVVGEYSIPSEDRVLALKLLIETDEAQFLKTAVDRGARNPIGNGTFGVYHGVVLHEEPQRVPQNMRETLLTRAARWMKGVAQSHI